MRSGGVMAIVKSASVSNLAVATTITLPNSYQTQLNDVVIVAIGTANANWSSSGSNVTVSGLGATWIVKSQNSGTQLQGNWFAIGYGCTAGGTTITLSSNPSTTGGMGVVVFSGASSSAPTAMWTTPLTTSTLNTTVSQSGLSWTAGQLLVDFGETYTWASSSPVGTWGSNTDNFGTISGSGRQAYVSYAIPSSAASSQTYTSPQSSSSYGIGEVYGYSFTPATSSGGMFLAMGA
jgi:hypothetical protein